jgi:hypothetical protein
MFGHSEVEGSSFVSRPQSNHQGHGAGSQNNTNNLQQQQGKPEITVITNAFSFKVKPELC